jgi:hypothetical protein
MATGVMVRLRGLALFVAMTVTTLARWAGLFCQLEICESVLDSRGHIMP